MHDFKQFFQSQTFRGMLIGMGVFLALLLIFQAGVFVGFRKAAFAYHYGENYYRIFGGREHSGMPMQDMMSGAHGVIGRIVSIDLPSLVVEGPDGIEKVVVLSDATRVKHFNDAVASSSLSSGDFILVLGSPDEQSHIKASFIRVVPPPPGMEQSSTTIR